LEKYLVEVETQAYIP